MARIYSQCGYNTRNTSRDKLQGPRELGGGAFITLHVTASTGHVLPFLKHCRTPHADAGRLLRIVLAWFQHQAGVSYPVLQHTGQDLSYA